MQLITNLTRLVSVTAMTVALAACAAPAPRKPAATTTDKSFSQNDICTAAQTRGNPPPEGCQTRNTQYRSRTLPGLQEDPLLNVPVLPTLGAPRDGPLLGR